jgi:cob(I)alamin adenosyltransferase
MSSWERFVTGEFAAVIDGVRGTVATSGMEGWCTCGCRAPDAAHGAHMVHLDRIATRTGDDGTTGLGDGSRLPKHHPLIAAIGAVDEANCVLGVARLESLPPVVAQGLSIIQNDLFDVGSDLACPPGMKFEDKIPRITPAQVSRLDAYLAEANANVAPLTSFVLPGGTRAATQLHLARTVVRRAERDVSAAIATLPTRSFNPHLIHYLNRLSDLLFVWARLANGANDVLWVPGAGRVADDSNAQPR